MKPDLSDADLSGLDLGGLEDIGGEEEDSGAEDLRGVDLAGANLMGSNLRGTNLAGANLSGALLAMADLSAADLSRAYLSPVNLSGVNLNGARLDWANLSWNDLTRATLVEARLTGTNLSGANLTNTDLTKARLNGANLRWADLTEADLSHADLYGANLTHARLVKTNLSNAVLTSCYIYGISAWDLDLSGAKQLDLIISREGEADIAVDNLEVAQFLYLLLNNVKLRDVIDTLTTKVVLILGRFTPERLAVLEALRTALRQHDYVPVLFNFEGPENQNVLATVATVARLARFVVADVTDAKAVDQELQAVVPQIKVPVRPLLLEETEPPGAVLQTLWHDYPDRLLKVHRYHDLDGLLVSFKEKVIDPAEAKAKDLKLRELEDIFE